MGSDTVSIFKFNAMILILVILFSGITSAIQPVNPDLTDSARQILNYFESIYGKKVLSGYNVYVHTPDDYEQTGKQAAIWGRDIQWLGDVDTIIEHARSNRYILTLHWHWFYNDDSAWTGKRKNPVNLSQVVTPDTPEYRQLLKELAHTADILQKFQDADIPVLWRPLHEIDGGWFWWTDKDHPENTARLWQIMFDYFTHTRKLNNLIWVYSAGEGNKSVELRKRFYPGPNYVDISGLDIYHVDFKNEIKKYHDYFDIMTQVSPGKMLACGECDAIPNPDKMLQNQTPRWLYALPWWGAPSSGRPVDWATDTMRHDLVITLDELPPLGQGNIIPHVGILNPADNGTAWFPGQNLTIESYAVDRDGIISRVEFYANDNKIGQLNKSPYTLIWTDMPAGFYDIHTLAFDNRGSSNRSNNIRVAVNMTDLARNRPVTASSGSNPELATDENYYTSWSSGNSDQEWLYVDLGQVQTIDRVNLLWGWKIHASNYTIDIATADPQDPSSWTTIHTRKNRPYQQWKATDRIQFEPVEARFVRLNATGRAGNQNWAGYNLMAFEVPVVNNP